MTTLVRSASMTRYSEVARALGLDPVRMVGHVGLDQTCLYTPDLRIPEVRLAELLEVSARSLAAPSLGLMVGEAWRLSDFGVISLFLQQQPTVRHALCALATYRHLLSESVTVEIEDFNQVSVIRIVLFTGRPVPGRQPVELAVAATLSIFRNVLGRDWMPRHVHFSHSAPVTTSIHRRVLGASVDFDCEFDGIVVATEDLDRPNPLADVNMAQYARDYLDLQPRPNDKSVTEEVRRAVHLLLPRGRSNIESVGQSLGVSPRTLQRQLEQAGVNFVSVMNHVRSELAERHLSNPSCSVSQVAGLLGFSEVSAFSRWFGGQFGVSPSGWRNARLNARPGAGDTA